LSAQPQNENLEVCPNCGNFVDHLNEVDGFCGACSENEKSPSSTKSLLHTESRIERWLTTNADTIEDTMVRYEISANEAIRIIAQYTPENATCACCGSEVKHVRHDSFFCNKTDKCKKARRYYKYLTYEKGLDKEEAFEKAVRKFK
jgi:hypothetical protein